MPVRVKFLFSFCLVFCILRLIFLFLFVQQGKAKEKTCLGLTRSDQALEIKKIKMCYHFFQCGTNQIRRSVPEQAERARDGIIIIIIIIK